MSNLLWKLWYGDWTTFSNLDGRVEEAPIYNVQVCVQRQKAWGKVEALHRTGVDWYIFWVGDGKWHFHDEFQGKMFIAQHPFETAVKYGCEIDLDVYNTILQAAINDKKSW